MNIPEVLVICKHPEILSTILRLLGKKEGWKSYGVASVEEAAALCKTTSINIVLFGAGVEETEEQQLRSDLSALRPGIVFVRHYGGGSGLLYGEVLQALR